MARSVAVSKVALAKARERRRQLDRDRDARDQRIEEETARALVALEALAAADAARDAAAAAAGEVVKALLAEDVTPERAAGLLELEAVEVRRLAKIAGVEAPGLRADVGGKPNAQHAGSGGPTVTPVPERGRSVDAARRVG